YSVILVVSAYLHIASAHIVSLPSRRFFVPAAATTEISPLSLHDALPISFKTTAVFFTGRKSSSLASHFFTSAVVSPSVKKWDARDRKSTRLNSSHVSISYAVFCLKKKTAT